MEHLLKNYITNQNLCEFKIFNYTEDVNEKDIEGTERKEVPVPTLLKLKNSEKFC